MQWELDYHLFPDAKQPKLRHHWSHIPKRTLWKNQESATQEVLTKLLQLIENFLLTLSPDKLRILTLQSLKSFCQL
jgi:hypothetical protein